MTLSHGSCSYERRIFVTNSLNNVMNEIVLRKLEMQKLFRHTDFILVAELHGNVPFPYPFSMKASSNELFSCGNMELSDFSAKKKFWVWRKFAKMRNFRKWDMTNAPSQENKVHMQRQTRRVCCQFGLCRYKKCAMYKPNWKIHLTFWLTKLR